MLFFGFIRDYKGLDMLLLAMTDERLKKAGIKLIVAGEYYGKAIQATCEQIIAEHGLQDRVILHTGFIANNEIRYFFSAADVVVLPYRDATQSGITQVAYHFEKPIIVTNVGGLAEVVPDGKVGFVAEPDPASIAGAVLKFFGPASIPGIRDNILHEKQKYQWDTFTRVLLSTAFGK